MEQRLLDHKLKLNHLNKERQTQSKEEANHLGNKMVAGNVCAKAVPSMHTHDIDLAGS